MKTLRFVFALGFLVATIPEARAAVPADRDAFEYVTPEESIAASSRGAMTYCNTRKGAMGKRSLTFKQMENQACPVVTDKAVGWDRPVSEPVSPGVPFQDQGIERF